jgi:hypothetical protein
MLKIYLGKDGNFDDFVGYLSYIRLTVGPQAALQEDSKIYNGKSL